jgi:hypothetical protein
MRDNSNIPVTLDGGVDIKIVGTVDNAYKRFTDGEKVQFEIGGDGSTNIKKKISIAGEYKIYASILPSGQLANSPSSIVVTQGIIDPKKTIFTGYIYMFTFPHLINVCFFHSLYNPLFISCYKKFSETYLTYKLFFFS